MVSQGDGLWYELMEFVTGKLYNHWMHYFIYDYFYENKTF